MTEQSYDFYGKLARMFNSSVSRSVVLGGNISDLFWNGKDYVPLISFLLDKTVASNMVQIVYEINTPIRISRKDRDTLKDWWVNWKLGMVETPTSISKKDIEFLQQQFEGYFSDAIGSPAAALEFMRQLCYCSRSTNKQPLLIFIGGCDMLLPVEEISKLNDSKLKCISIVQNWFGDPAFVNGKDSVCLIAESRSLINEKISRMPQIVSIEIESPDLDNRIHYINEFLKQKNKEWPSGEFKDVHSFAAATAGLSIYALRQMLMAALYANESVTVDDVTEKVEQYIQSQLGEGVVEFKKPKHKLKDIIGYRLIKKFFIDEVIPRFKGCPEASMTGAVICGSIGSGKTFICEALAAELGLPVIVLKNLRSKWFGETDVIFERLNRVLMAMNKVVVFVDEADVQFGNLQNDAHETEKRLTGKIQAMMSDTSLKGRILWLLMTARIDQLSPDLRRPGRVGDLVIPILDPTGQDEDDFIKWTIGITGLDLSQEDFEKVKQVIGGYSSAAFSSLRLTLNYKKCKSVDEILKVCDDLLSPDITLSRRYQTLQALLNCSRKSLLPPLDDGSSLLESKNKWQVEIVSLKNQIK